MAWYDDEDYRYVSAAEKRKQTAKRLAKLRQRGAAAPVEITGQTIATTFWGQAWCKNLERYSDYASRMPRGRSYVRSGAVIDLDISNGEVRALVSGTELYEVAVTIKPLAPARWRAIVAACAGKLGSLVDLLRGQLSPAVMGLLTRPDEGLFPAPREIAFTCSCPDVASLCKHVAAALYGVGARLDTRPELFFTLRHVDHQELVNAAGSAARWGATPAPGGRKTIARGRLSSLFGIDLDGGGRPPPLPVPADATATARPAPAAHKAPKASKEQRGSKAQKGSKARKGNQGLKSKKAPGPRSP